MDEESVHDQSCLFRNQPYRPGHCDCVPMKNVNVFENQEVEDSKAQHPSNSVLEDQQAEVKEHISVLALATEETIDKLAKEGLTTVNLEQTADAFKNLAREYMRAFMMLETISQSGAQMCLDLAEALSEVENHVNTTNEGESND